MITLIYPLDELNDTRFEIIKEGIKTLKQQHNPDFKVIYVVEEQDKDEWELKLKMELAGLEHAIIASPKDSNFQQKAMIAVTELVDTPFFVPMLYTDVAFKNMTYEYHNAIALDSDKSIYLPFVIEYLYVKDGKPKLLNMSNSIAWFNAIGGVNGEVSDMKLKDRHGVNNFSLWGALINTEHFVHVGGFKQSMPIYWDYEYMLRALHYSGSINVIPKTTLQHINNHVENDLADYSAITKEERTFYLKTAMEESIHNYDREKQYRQ